jgi:FKBP-type peptidyl-prolyl cis-trans isomerase FkpA
MLSTPALAVEISKTDDQKTLYALGLIVYKSLAVFNLSPAELEFVKQGLMDAGTGKKPEVELKDYNDKVQELARTRRKAAGDMQTEAGKEYLEKAAKEKGAVKTTSGMVYLSLSDGTEFDSSYKRGKPLEFKLDNVIKCWTEGLQKMKPGGKAKLVCPSNLAYGDNGAGEMILPGATLDFVVELLEVNDPGAATKQVTPPTKLNSP